MQPLVYTDFYKTDHRRQYPKGTTEVYSNLTPRGTRIQGINEVVVFGVQYFIKEYLIKRFNEGFFNVPKDVAVAKYRRRLDNALGKDAVGMEHIEALHDLGYLPIKIKALPEGTECPMRIPLLTIRNTKPEFFWVTNFLETVLCNVLWGPITSATIARKYRKILDGYAEATSDLPELVSWQGHDFSMRGLMGMEASMVSGGGHLLSFTGTDTIAAIDFLEEYYGADSDKELIGGSVPATEHSVMCLGGEGESEIDTFRRLITEVYPSGIISIVSDTWDYWKVITEFLPKLKDEIMARDGKVVIRPDSGDPTKIICGYDQAKTAGHGDFRAKGSIELMWETFGGTMNSKGFKQLDSHIGLIYGDSITLDRCEDICAKLLKKGFASTNMVYGIGSYTYQHVTRDTFGFAMKATYGVVDGVVKNIYKDPVTDDGLKKSAKGLLKVNSDLTLSEEVTPEEEDSGLLQQVFLDGKLTNEVTLSQIRDRLSKKANV
ncbi:nicotinate phosphoribosyltransferase [Patescibacteria group bacterium]|nr:nicotinate phosphoribosyltransferase [Patescibacteria group bacterium]